MGTETQGRDRRVCDTSSSPARMHMAETLLDLRLHARKDAFRTRHPFSIYFESANAFLFNTKYDRRRKNQTYIKWLENNQPCVFGKIADKTKNTFICLLEEHEILAMRNGDADLRDTIQDYR